MTAESDVVPLRHKVAELRSLLDLSYARERALLDACNGLLFLTAGAAVAPDRQDKQEKITTDARAAVELVNAHPVQNHGLMLAFYNLQAERVAQDTVIDRLREVNSELLSRVTSLTRDVADTGVRLQLAEETARQVGVLVGAPAMADRVRAVVEQAVAAHQAKPKEGT